MLSRSFAPGWNVSPRLGHSIRSKSTRLTRSGVIVAPHFGHILSWPKRGRFHNRKSRYFDCAVVRVQLFFGGIFSVLFGVEWRQSSGQHLSNQLYRLSPVRNDLQMAEFFESIFAEFNANPWILITAEWNVGMEIEVLIDPNHSGIKPTCYGVQ
jgi:hypothetical protein